MKVYSTFATFTLLYVAMIAGTGCSKPGEGDKGPKNLDSIPVVMADTLAPDTVIPEPEPISFEGTNEIIEYMESLPDAERFRGGVLYSAAREVPEYAQKLLNSKFDRFIVVDKARLMVILYDKYGQVERSYDMACAKNYGTKHKKADSRTPEGFFSVEGIYNSTDWLFTDDDGRTSDKKGQFGPRFIRLRIPTTSQIGIHGTCSPWSMGHRVSHGCIRILNENIMELVDLVEPGMPVIVLPGKRDRAVNREEGFDIPYFPTDPKYAMTDAEKRLPFGEVKKAEEEKEKATTPPESSDESGKFQEPSEPSGEESPTEQSQSKEEEKESEEANIYF